MKWLVGILLGATLPSGGQEAKEGHQEECKKAFDSFRQSYRSGAEPARVAAVQELGKHRCEKATHAIAAMLVGEAVSVRVAAAKILAADDDPHAVEALSKAVLPNAQNREVLEAIARALEALGWEAGAEALNPLLKKHDDDDVLESLDVVVQVLGKLGSASSVEPLIEFLQHCENEGTTARRGKRGLPGGEAKMRALKAPAAKALAEITGGSAPSAREWKEWWQKNRERLLAGATLLYRCKGTGKTWARLPGEAGICPDHSKSSTCSQMVRARLRPAKGGK